MFIQWKVQRIVNNGKYLRAYVPDHPKANKHGYVLHHRVQMENKLGRMLTDREVVHHIDKNGRNNHPSNLELIATQEEHFALHKEQDGLLGRTFVKITCAHCKTEFDREIRQMHRGSKNHFCTRKCIGLFNHRSKKHASLV